MLLRSLVRRFCTNTCPRHVAAAPAKRLIVMGGGVMGLHSALSLARASAADGTRLTLLERAPGTGAGSSGDSSAILRFLYTHDNMVRLSKLGFAAYKDWQQYLNAEQDPIAKMHPTPVLWMLGADAETMQATKDRLAAQGVKASVLNSQDVQSRWPALASCDAPLYQDQTSVEIDWDHECQADPTRAFLVEEEAAYFDPTGSMLDLVQALEKQDNVDIRFNSSVKQIQYGDQEDGVPTVSSVVLESGEEICADAVVACPGPWVPSFLRSIAGPIDIPAATIQPTRIQVAYRSSPELFDDDGSCSVPITVDVPGGLYFRPQHMQKQILFGSIREADEREAVEDPSNLNASLDPDMKQRMLMTLHHRIPSLDARGAVTGFSGMYTVNEDDVHPLLGSVRGVNGLYLAAGFSGHGFKIAPVVGSLMTRAVLRDFGGSAQGPQASAWAPPAEQADNLLEWLNPYRERIVMEGEKNVLA